MKWLLLVIQCKLPLGLDRGLELDGTSLGTVLLRILSSPRAMVSMVTHSTLHLANSFLPIPISRFHRAAKSTHSMRGIQCISTVRPSTTSTASSFHRLANPPIPHVILEVWSPMYIGRYSMVASLAIQTTRRARTGSSGCFTRHFLWPF